VWVPVTVEMFAGMVRQDVQPPVLPTAKLPTGVADPGPAGGIQVGRGQLDPRLPLGDEHPSRTGDLSAGGAAYRVAAEGWREGVGTFRRRVLGNNPVQVWGSLQAACGLHSWI